MNIVELRFGNLGDAVHALNLLSLILNVLNLRAIDLDQARPRLA